MPQSRQLTKTVKLPWQDQPVCHLRNKNQNYLNIITINSIRGRIKPLFFSELVRSKLQIWQSRRACQNSNLAETLNSQLPWQNRPACHNQRKKNHLNIFRYIHYNIIRWNIKPLFNQASVLEITNLLDHETSQESHNASLLVCAVVCAKLFLLGNCEVWIKSRHFSCGFTQMCSFKS